MMINSSPETVFSTQTVPLSGPGDQSGAGADPPCEAIGGARFGFGEIAIQEISAKKSALADFGC